MSSTFTPSQAVDMSKEKDWPMNIGGSSSLVSLATLKYNNRDARLGLDQYCLHEAFPGRIPQVSGLSVVSKNVRDPTTSTSLGRYAGVTVDPGFTNIQKLPRFAKFGKLSANDEGSPASVDALASSPQVAPSTGSSRLLGEEFTDDALSTAPPRPVDESSGSSSAEKESVSATAEFKPTRRVRTTPGGTSTVGSIFTDDIQEQFVPTRKVRQRPGGNDNIEGLF